MEHDLKKIFKFLESERLSENERIQMRNVLRSVMRENPLQSPAGITRFEQILSYFNTAALRPVGFAFAMVLIVGAGTSYAAQRALPGDPLYAVKVNLTEPLEGALAVSPVAKAQWNTELINRRLEEAATLAANGGLNDAARAQIESQITQKAADVNANVQALGASPDSAVDASNVESDLEASLVGHERVLTGLSIDHPTQAPALAPILHKVRVQAEDTNNRRKTADQTVALNNDDTVKAAADAQREQVHQKIQNLRVLAASSRLHASTTAEASSSVSEIEQAIDSGDQQLNQGKFGKALTTFQASLRAAKAVEVNLDAENRLGGDRENNSSDDTHNAAVSHQ